MLLLLIIILFNLLVKGQLALEEQNYVPLYKFAANKGADCNLYSQDGSVSAYKVLIFIDSLFVENFLNWVEYYRLACDESLHHLEVVCMDGNIGRLLKREDIACSPSSFVMEGPIKEQALNTVWFQRLRIINEFLAQGVSVILSDADAIWLQSPLPDLRELSLTADVVSSRAWWPFHLQEQWGACLCMGFIYIKAGAPADLGRALFAAIYETSATQQRAMEEELELAKLQGLPGIAAREVKRPNDQTAINEQLRAWGIQWRRPRMEVENSTQVDIGDLVLPPSSIAAVAAASRGGTAGEIQQAARADPPLLGEGVQSVGTARQYQVALLPHNRYPRKCVARKRVAAKLGSSVSAQKTNSTDVERSDPGQQQQTHPMRVAGNGRPGTSAGLEGMEDMVVAHCRLPKGDGRGKKSLQIRYGLWALSSGVRAHPATADGQAAGGTAGGKGKRRGFRGKAKAKAKAKGRPRQRQRTEVQP